MKDYEIMSAHPWQEIEFTLTSAQDYPNGYTDVEVWADFTHDSGATLRRPAFWDGDRTWRIRFSSPLSTGRWTWRSFSSVADAGLAEQTGVVACEAGPEAANRFYRHGQKRG